MPGKWIQAKRINLTNLSMRQSLNKLFFLVVDGHSTFILFIDFYVALRMEPRAPHVPGSAPPQSHDPDSRLDLLIYQNGSFTWVNLIFSEITQGI